MAFTPAQLKGKIKNLALQNNADARLLMRIYMMNRFLERLSESPYRDYFIIKGGILVTSMVGVAMRSTMDIDASIKNINLDKDNALRVVTEIASRQLDDGVTFDVKKISTIMDDFEYPGIRIEMDALMGRMNTPIKIDISTGDIITPKEVKYSYDLIIDERKINLWTYNLETILAEKLQTILARGVFNTRMRDFYDVYVLLKLYGEEIDKPTLKAAFLATSKKRNSIITNAEEQIKMISESEDIRNLWEQYREKYIYASEIDFERVIESIKILAKELVS